MIILTPTSELGDLPRAGAGADPIFLAYVRAWVLTVVNIFPSSGEAGQGY